MEASTDPTPAAPAVFRKSLRDQSASIDPTPAAPAVFRKSLRDQSFFLFDILNPSMH
jgi:hypothetical protein